MIDRKKGPKITTEFDLSIHDVQQSTLDNGLALYEVNSGTQDIIRVELVFKTGRIHETKRASAAAAVSLLREGSTRHSSQELAHSYDFYGAAVKASCNMEHVSLSLVVVERYFAEVWPIWFHMVFYPQYSDSEISKYKQVKSQKLINQLAQNDVVSYRKLTEYIFGSDHPYGYNTETEDIHSLNRKSILNFYNANLGLDDAVVILSGKYSPATRAMILDDLSSKSRVNNHPPVSFEKETITPQRFQMPTESKIQTSIKIGRTLFPRKHPEFTKMSCLNMIFGGYFGSRLMKNIREEKGYTYGIYSSLHGWKDDGFLYISADVDNSYIEPTLNEIKIEMQKLRSEKIPTAELEMVKTYILGQSLHLLDGPFAKGHLIKKLQAKNLTMEDYKQHIAQLKNITTEDIYEMAQKYLDPEDYSVVLAGQA